MHFGFLFKKYMPEPGALVLFNSQSVTGCVILDLEKWGIPWEWDSSLNILHDRIEMDVKPMQSIPPLPPKGSLIE